MKQSLAFLLIKQHTMDVRIVYQSIQSNVSLSATNYIPFTLVQQTIHPTGLTHSQTDDGKTKFVTSENKN